MELNVEFHITPSVTLSISRPCVRFVEIAGFEPASKQGTNTLSTCLSRPEFSTEGKTRATYLQLIC